MTIGLSTVTFNSHILDNLQSSWETVINKQGYYNQKAYDTLKVSLETIKTLRPLNYTPPTLDPNSDAMKDLDSDYLKNLTTAVFNVPNPTPLDPSVRGSYIEGQYGLSDLGVTLVDVGEVIKKVTSSTSYVGSDFPVHRGMPTKGRSLDIETSPMSVLVATILYIDIDNLLAILNTARNIVVEPPPSNTAEIILTGDDPYSLTTSISSDTTYVTSGTYPTFYPSPSDHVTLDVLQSYIVTAYEGANPGSVITTTSPLTVGPNEIYKDGNVLVTFNVISVPLEVVFFRDTDPKKDTWVYGGSEDEYALFQSYLSPMDISDWEIYYDIDPATGQSPPGTPLNDPRYPGGMVHSLVKMNRVTNATDPSFSQEVIKIPSSNYRPYYSSTLGATYEPIPGTSVEVSNNYYEIDLSQPTPAINYTASFNGVSPTPKQRSLTITTIPETQGAVTPPPLSGDLYINGDNPLELAVNVPMVYDVSPIPGQEINDLVYDAISSNIKEEAALITHLEGKGWTYAPAAIPITLDRGKVRRKRLSFSNSTGSYSIVFGLSPIKSNTSHVVRMSVEDQPTSIYSLRNLMPAEMGYDNTDAGLSGDGRHPAALETVKAWGAATNQPGITSTIGISASQSQPYTVPDIDPNELPDSVLYNWDGSKRIDITYIYVDVVDSGAVVSSHKVLYIPTDDQKYIEKGAVYATSDFNTEPVPGDIVSDNVDKSVIGSYSVEYGYTGNGLNLSKTRVVNVSDLPVEDGLIEVTANVSYLDSPIQEGYVRIAGSDLPDPYVAVINGVAVMRLKPSTFYFLTVVSKDLPNSSSTYTMSDSGTVDGSVGISITSTGSIN